MYYVTLCLFLVTLLRHCADARTCFQSRSNGLKIGQSATVTEKVAFVGDTAFVSSAAPRNSQRT